MLLFLPEARAAIVLSIMFGGPVSLLVTKFSRAHQEHAVNVSAWAKHLGLFFYDTTAEGTVRAILPDEQAAAWQEGLVDEGVTRFEFLLVHSRKSRAEWLLSRLRPTPTLGPDLLRLSQSGTDYEEKFHKARNELQSKVRLLREREFADYPEPLEVGERDHVSSKAIYDYAWARLRARLREDEALFPPLKETSYQGATRYFRIQLQEGTHILATNVKQGALKVNIEALLTGLSNDDETTRAIREMERARTKLEDDFRTARPDLVRYSRIVHANRDVTGRCPGCPRLV